MQSAADGAAVEVVGDTHLGRKGEPLVYLGTCHECVAYAVSVIHACCIVVENGLFIQVDTAILIIGTEPPDVGIDL